MTTKEERIIMRISTLLSALVMMATFQPVQAEILAEAQGALKFHWLKNQVHDPWPLLIFLG